MGATQSTTNSVVLETKKGKLRGTEQKDLNGQSVLQRFTKIPYAKPPVGNLRWRRPQPLDRDFSFSTASGEPGDYSSFGPICPQPEYAHGAAKIDNPNSAPEIENVQSEDCLYMNIWVPTASRPPSAGWPVQFHIHGGWLQVGDANQDNESDPFDLFAHSTPRIIVAPTYRLNMFGFLAGRDVKDAGEDPAPGNYGLWDQRAALEWVHENITLFGGNPDLITVGGLSAGSHSAFLQLYYDTYQQESKRLIKQVYQWSNAMAIQPNPSTSQVLTDQFNSLCEVLSVGKNATSPQEKLDALRAVSAKDLVAAIPKLNLHTFRTSTDNDFVPDNFLKTIHDGTFTALLAQHKIRIMFGEVSDEALLYKLVNPPRNHADLVRQLTNYYPPPVVGRLLELKDVYDVPEATQENQNDENLQKRYEDVFARIAADMQVHASIRGFSKSLLNPPNGGGTPEIMRYRISWRAKGLDNFIKPEVGVCHAADGPIWWLCGRRAGYDENDNKTALEFLKPFGDFLEGRQWPAINGSTNGSRASRIQRYIDPKGNVSVDVEDELWDKGLRVWNAVAETQGVLS